MNIACKMVENMHYSTLFVHMHTKNVVLTLICGAKDTTKVFVSTGGAICGGGYLWGYFCKFRQMGLSAGGGAIWGGGLSAAVYSIQFFDTSKIRNVPAPWPSG